MKKLLLTSALGAMMAFVCNAQIVNIPDPAFKNYLLNHYYHSNPGGSGIQINLDANNDDEIQVSEATNYPGDLVNYAFHMSGLGIADLTGIEAFTAIKKIYVSNNQLTSLSLNGCTSLKYLDCSNNPLTSFTIANPALLELNINNCPQLTTIDIHSSQSITKFTCQQNASLTSLNLAGCWWLQELRVNFNPLLTSLDFGMYFYNYLTLFQCGSNGLTSLDVSHLNVLQTLVCTGNQLTSLNLANGHAQSFQIISANGYPNLFCIQVDNAMVAEVLWAPGGYYAFDSWAVFHTDCANYNPNPTCTITIPDTNFKNALLSNSAINTNGNGEIECTEAVAYSGAIEVDNLNITDMTGLEAFVNITALSCNNQQTIFGAPEYLTSLNVSGLTALTTVSCAGNVGLASINATGCTSLTGIEPGGSYAELGVAINLSNCTALTHLDLNGKNLGSLNINGCTALASLNCGNNLIATLDVSDSPLLTSLHCNNNLLTSLSMFNNPAMDTLNCSYNQLSYLIVSLNPALKLLNCSHNNITYLDLYNNTALVTLNCSHNSLNTLSVNNNPVLFNADCSYNNLPTINVSADAALNTLNCSYNQLTTVNVSANTELKYLYCGYNNIPSLDVSANAALETLSCPGNNMPGIDVSSNTNLKNLDCSYNQLSSLDLLNNSGMIVLDCSHNQMTSLDIRNDIQLYLVQLACGNNQLTELSLTNVSTIILLCDSNNLQTLNIANGMNNMPGFTLWANSNPELTCVQVDDADYSNTNWVDSPFIIVDEGVSYSESCTVPSFINELPLAAFMVYPNPTNGMVYFSSTAHAQVTDVTGRVLLKKRNATTLDISNQPTGIYFITLTDEQGKVLHQQKLVKE